MKKYKYILWDFNGTIYDDVISSMESTNELLLRRGLKPINGLDDMRAGFGFPVKDYYEKLGFDYSLEDYESIAAEWLELYIEKSRAARLCHGIEKYITKLNKLRYSQTIISACEEALLREKLSTLGLYDMFEAISGTDNISGHSKNANALEWRRKHPEASAVMIGDTLHDFEIAGLIGADCILYCKGYQSRERLLTCGCPVIDDFGQLIDLI